MVSFVVLGDGSPDWRPHVHVYERWGCRKTLEFPTAKLLDYRGREAELEAHANPFALLVLAHLLALQTRQDMAARRDGKVRLIRLLYERKLEAEEKRQWLRILDWVLDLPSDLTREVIEQTSRIGEGLAMAHLTSFERYGLEKGLTEGRKEGRKEGLKEAITAWLRTKFGELDEPFRQALDKAEGTTLQQVLAAIPAAASLDDVRRLLPPANGQAGQP